MTDTHDSHADHPLTATLVMLVVVGVFTAIFGTMNKAYDAPVVLAAALMTLYGLLQIWVLDKE